MDIHVTIFNNEIYFKAKDCAKLLKYKDTNNAIKKHVYINNKIKYENISKSNNLHWNEKNTIYINKLGLTELIMKHRTIVSDDVINNLINRFDLNLNLITKSKEQKYINIIIECFKNHKYKTQYNVYAFYIDLYFIDLKLAIECDENNHKDRDKKYDNNRQALIENYLKCKFIRFNPDDKNFNIFTIINQIHVTILNN